MASELGTGHSFRRLVQPGPRPLIRGTRDRETGSLVLYSKAFADGVRQYGYAWVERYNQAWQGRDARYMELPPQVLDPDRQLAYNVRPLEHGTTTVLLIYGAALTPTIHSVEVELADGTTLHDQLTNGMFGILGPRIHRADLGNVVDEMVREVRALDADGTIVQRLPAARK